MNAAPAAVYEFEEFRLDPDKRVLWRNDRQVPLTPRVFDTLLFLVTHRGDLLEKERLMDAVWPDAVVEENNLTQNISTLRRIFGDTPGSHRFIVTVPGRGYRFVADVRSRQQTPERNVPASKTPGVAPVEPSVLPAPPRPRRAIIFTTALAILAICLAFFLLRSRFQPPARKADAPVIVPEKSVAVLPFANLSTDKENAFFAEGIQDDILTALAKIADLKVISRTSVVGYSADSARNLREIGQELGVANILEGSVRRAGGKVRVTAQLIDTATNTHLWAETYDRELVDVFAIQSDIAQQIAGALKAKLAPDEKARLEVRPTANAEAYILYLTAVSRTSAVNSSIEDQIAAEQFYEQATTLDPNFALAYARASIINSGFGANGDEARRAKARAQAEQALRLAPTLGEAHMALGLCLYLGDKKYDAALKEFETAAASSPNNAEIYGHCAGIYRRQGRWRESLAGFDRALSLDPGNRSLVFLAANNRLFIRDWVAAAAGYKRNLELAPDSVIAKIALAYTELFQKGDPALGAKILQSIPAGVDPDNSVTLTRWDFAMLQHDYAAASKIAANLPEAVRPEDEAPKSFYQGRSALAQGDQTLAQAYFEAARPMMEKKVQDDPAGARRHANLGLLYAYMQRKQDAIRESRRAVEIEPESQNAFHGALHVANLAVVFALLGERDEALPLIERLLITPGAVTYPYYPGSISQAELRLRWEWDSIRNEARFQKLITDPEPKTILSK